MEEEGEVEEKKTKTAAVVVDEKKKTPISFRRGDLLKRLLLLLLQGVFGLRHLENRLLFAVSSNSHALHTRNGDTRSSSSISLGSGRERNEKKVYVSKDPACCCFSTATAISSIGGTNVVIARVH